MPQNCSICLGPLEKELAIISCGHVFHRDCLESAMRTKARCPECVGAVDLTRIDPTAPNRRACHMVIPIFLDTTNEPTDDGAGPAEAEEGMTKEQLITKLDGARERDAILRRKLEIGDEDLMEFARKQSELVDHLAESREQTRNLENALVQAERSTYAAKGELNICEAEKINLESQLKTYVKLKEERGDMQLELAELRKVVNRSHGAVWDDASYGKVKQNKSGFQQLSFRTRILKKELEQLQDENEKTIQNYDKKQAKFLELRSVATKQGHSLDRLEKEVSAKDAQVRMLKQQVFALEDMKVPVHGSGEREGAAAGSRLGASAAAAAAGYDAGGSGGGGSASQGGKREALHPTDRNSKRLRLSQEPSGGSGGITLAEPVSVTSDLVRFGDFAGHGGVLYGGSSAGTGRVDAGACIESGLSDRYSDTNSRGGNYTHSGGGGGSGGTARGGYDISSMIKIGGHRVNITNSSGRSRTGRKSGFMRQKTTGKSKLDGSTEYRGFDGTGGRHTIVRKAAKPKVPQQTKLGGRTWNLFAKAY